MVATGPSSCRTRRRLTPSGLRRLTGPDIKASAQLRTLPAPLEWWVDAAALLLETLPPSAGRAPIGGLLRKTPDISTPSILIPTSTLPAPSKPHSQHSHTITLTPSLSLPGFPLPNILTLHIPTPDLSDAHPDHQNRCSQRAFKTVASQLASTKIAAQDQRKPGHADAWLPSGSER